jgi:putative transposase
MPTVRGKDGGTRSLCHGKTRIDQHTFNRPGYGAHTAPMAVIRTHRRDPKTNKRIVDWWVFTMIGSTLSARAVRAQYRLRFGIESSYRLLGQARITTSSRNPVLRFAFMVLGLILVNIWVSLRWRYCQIPRRGRAGRAIDHARLRFHRMLSFTRQALEKRYGVVSSIQASALPLHANP